MSAAFPLLGQMALVGLVVLLPQRCVPSVPAASAEPAGPSSCTVRA